MNYRDVLDLRRLDAAASSYSDLGALRLVPIGLFGLFLSLLVGGSTNLPAKWEELAGVWGLMAAVGTFWVVCRWYRDEYGLTAESWPISESEANRWAVAWGGASVPVASALVGSGVAADLFGCLAGAALLVAMLVYWRRKGKMPPQCYALTGMLMMGMLLHWSALYPFGHAYATWSLFLTGAAMVAVGVIDHWRLVAVRKTLEEDEGGE